MRTNLVTGLICLLGMTLWLTGCSSKPQEEKVAPQSSTPAATDAPQDPAKLRKDLIELIEKGDPTEKLLAVEALGKLGAEGKPDIDVLRKAMGDSDPLLKVAAAQAILLIDDQDDENTKAAIQTLTEVINSEEGHAQMEAARALGNADGRAQPAIDELAEALKDEERHVAIHAAEALSRIGPSSVPALIEVLKDDKGRPYALLVLEEMGPEAKSAIPTLTELLEEKDPTVRRSAILALAAIGPDASGNVDVFTKALDDEDPLTRASAAFALSRMGDAAKGSKEALTKTLSGSDPFVAILAAVALVDLGLNADEQTARIVEVLIAGLKDEHPRVRVAAAESIAKLGPKAKDAEPALQEAAKDKIERVSKAATDALSKVKG